MIIAMLSEASVCHTVYEDPTLTPETVPATGVVIDEYDTTYLGGYYDQATKKWTKTPDLSTYMWNEEEKEFQMMDFAVAMEALQPEPAAEPEAEA